MTMLPGRKIGPYRVVELLGQGGMGDVYAGVDERLDRKVALKVLRADLHPGPETQQRFLREARVLSQVAHPNICQIYDYLSADGLEVLVLELIEGESLGRAMKHKPASPDRLGLARQIAGALLAAHEKGIIHRDLKPDNIMITAGGQVKILDFGISRLQEDGPEPARPASPDAEAGATRVVGAQEEATALSSPYGTRSSSLTAMGSIIGTLAYMSPEQARGEMAQAPSDLYAFGLLLQELFTGRRAYPRGLETGELLARVREGRTLPLEGVDADLAALVARLTAFAPAARPSSADTVDRLDWILARPRRRRRTVLVAAALAVMALFSAGMAVQTVRARRATRTAREEAETARRVSAFLTGLFKVSDPGEARGNAVTARELLDKGAATIGRELAGQPRVRTQLMDTMGVAYLNMGLYPQARVLLAGALSERERTPDTPALLVAESREDLGLLCLKEGRFKEAEALFQSSLATREKALGPSDLAVAASRSNLGSALHEQGKYAQAEPLFVKSLQIREQAGSPDLTTSLNNLAALYWRQGKYAQAEPLMLRNLQITERTLGPDHPDVALALTNLGILCRKGGRYPESVAYLQRSLAIGEKVLGPDHPRVAETLSNLGATLEDQDRHAEAEPCYLRALAIQEKVLGPGHPELSRTLGGLAEVQAGLGRKALAIRTYRRSIAVAEKALGPDHPSLAGPLSHLGVIYVDAGDFASAEPLFLRSLKNTLPALGPRHPGVGNVLYGLARIEAMLGRPAEALAYLERAVQVDGHPAWLAKVATEPQLRSLHGRPAFDRIVAELGKKG